MEADGFLDIAEEQDFYIRELKDNILSFWLPRCLDAEYGGFVNCFDNNGENLVSYDKYTWSQGRFVWLFSRLATTDAPIFTESERRNFLELAGNGADFLMKHSLIGKDDWRCVFLMERDGKAKEVSPGAPLDMSIYADCFAVIGLGMYSYAAKDKSSFEFALNLYRSVRKRVIAGDFNTLPYPLSKRFRAHGIPMILDNTARELLRASSIFAPDVSDELKNDMKSYCLDILDHFVDSDYVMHEVISSDNQFIPQLLGQHQNPGHTIEDVWFMLDTAEICDLPIKDRIYRIALKAIRNGWDDMYGGILHFCGIDGGEPLGDNTGVENETMVKQLSGWGDKLWWVHSEALYSLLRCYIETGDHAFLDEYRKVKDYVFRVFPNDDPAIREWKQIRRRDGTPEDKVVALPVKDPFHIARDFILAIELMQKESAKEDQR